MPGEHVLRRDVSDGAVQTHVVVMLYVTLHQTKRIFERQRRPGPNALPFEGFVPTFDLAVRLRIVGVAVATAQKFTLTILSSYKSTVFSVSS